MSGRGCAGFVEALTCAVRAVRPAVDRCTNETLAKMLDEQLTRYCGTDHGMSQNELMATARDLKTAAASGD